MNECIPTQGCRIDRKVEEIAQRGASQFMLFVKCRNEKCLRNFAWFRASAALQTSSSRTLVVNRRCFRAKILRIFFSATFRCLRYKKVVTSEYWVRVPPTAVWPNAAVLLSPDGFYKICCFIRTLHFVDSFGLRLKPDKQ